MKKKWLGLFLFILLVLLFIYKDSLYIIEKVYVVYKKGDNFYKNAGDDNVFYYKKLGKVYELTSVQDKRISQKKYQYMKSLNIITIDSLSEILPLSHYHKSFLSKKKLDRLKKMRIFFIELDSIKNKINIKEVYQTHTEY